MASIRTRGSSIQVRWRQDGEPQSESFKDEERALTFKALVEAHGNRWPTGWVMGRGFVAPETLAEEAPKAPTMAEMHDRWVASNTGAGPTTKAIYRRSFTHIPGWFASKRIDEITKEDAGRLVLELRATDLSDSTLRKVWVGPKAALALARDDGIIAVNPMARLRVARRKGQADMSEVHQYLEGDEFELVLAHVPGPQERRDFFTLLFRTGLRIGEGVALRPEDIDLDRATLTVGQAWHEEERALGEPKTVQSARTIAIGPKDVAMLRPLVERGAAFLFLNDWGHMNKPDTLRSAWVVGRKRATAAHPEFTKRPRVHDLRHSHAAYLLSNGVELKAVSVRLGHSSYAITDSTYAHLLKKVDEQIRGLL